MRGTPQRKLEIYKMKIPFVDLKSQYQSIKSDMDQAIASVISETAFVGGLSNKYVSAFENSFANYLGLNNVITCANGTDSIEILLEALGVAKGDEVIVPALSWISTSEAVGRIGAIPVFVDVCEDTLLMDLDLLEKAITNKTKVIIPVHLYGNAVNMERLMHIANAHDIKVIEDCAQCHGARHNGRLTGTFGHAASFSFYPGKNLGAYGDAGCMATNDATLAQKCRMIANHGQLEKHNHLIEGRNSRLDGIHGAVLSVKLPHLDNWNAKRVHHANYYSERLASKGYVLPVVNTNSTHVFHLYVIRSENRDKLKKYLSEKGIENAIHYPSPLPLLKAYASRNYTSSDFPVAFNACNTMLSIPMFPELTKEQQDYIIDALIQFKTGNN